MQLTAWGGRHRKQLQVLIGWILLARRTSTLVSRRWEVGVSSPDPCRARLASQGGVESFLHCCRFSGQLSTSQVADSSWLDPRLELSSNCQSLVEFRSGWLAEESVPGPQCVVELSYKSKHSESQPGWSWMRLVEHYQESRTVRNCY